MAYAVKAAAKVKNKVKKFADAFGSAYGETPACGDLKEMQVISGRKKEWGSLEVEISTKANSTSTMLKERQHQWQILELESCPKLRERMIISTMGFYAAPI